MNHQDRLKKATELQQWAELEGTELGETCVALCNLAFNSTCLSDVMLAALDAELESQLENFTQNARIVEETETQTVTFKTIEWL